MQTFTDKLNAFRREQDDLKLRVHYLTLMLTEMEVNGIPHPYHYRYYRAELSRYKSKLHKSSKFGYSVFG